MNNQHTVTTQINSTTLTNSILVDGATGYIGSHLISALSKNCADKTKVHCLIRKNAGRAETDFLQTSGTSIFAADLYDDNAQVAFAGVDVACHLIGSIAPRRGESSASLHIGQTERFVEHCLKSKVKKIIMVSACGASAQADSAYHRTKWQAERIILQCGIPSVILRPSLVIGKISGVRNSKLITRFEHLIRNKKVMPLIGGGNKKVQPIFIQDLVEAIIASVDWVGAAGNNASSENVIEIGGPEVITLRELVQKMMSQMKIERPISSLPVPIASAVACVAQLIQAVPIISLDQVKLAQQDNICMDNKLQSLIGRSPTTVENALNSYHW